MALYMFLPKHAAIIEVSPAIMMTFDMLFINVHDGLSLILSTCLYSSVTHLVEDFVPCHAYTIKKMT